MPDFTRRGKSVYFGPDYNCFIVAVPSSPKGPFVVGLCNNIAQSRRCCCLMPRESQAFDFPLILELTIFCSTAGISDTAPAEP